MQQVKYYMLQGEPVLKVIKAEKEWQSDIAIIYDPISQSIKKIDLRYIKPLPVLQLSTHLKTKLIAGLAHIYKPENLYHEMKQRQLIN
jgi:hypothetical protein